MGNLQNACRLSETLKFHRNKLRNWGLWDLDFLLNKILTDSPTVYATGSALHAQRYLIRTAFRKHDADFARVSAPAGTFHLCWMHDSCFGTHWATIARVIWTPPWESIGFPHRDALDLPGDLVFRRSTFSESPGRPRLPEHSRLGIYF